MADGFIVRRGGKGSEQALAPTITEVSKTDTQIVFTIKNNDTSSAVILWEIGDTTPDANSLELAADTTSSNITVTGLTQNTAQVIYATANVTGKIKSNVTEKTITTDATPVYTAATGGTTTEYNASGKRFKSHTFTSNGTFTVTTVGDAAGDRNKVDYLVIAGGGGGGFNAGGGGGAGGYRTTLGTSGANSSAESKITVTAQGYSITIGGGGSGSTDSTSGGSGGNSVFSTITSTGGGRRGTTGGSGGGGQFSISPGSGTANQGFAGGAWNGTTNSRGGGGGASQAGNTNSVGAGGNGLVNTLRTGSNETRGGGGGGGTTSGGTVASGGTGGGGAGGLGENSPAATAGTANTGGGGGGGASESVGYAGANGGSGIVVIRYEIATV